ncbi:cupin domain-containing protein [Acuticoccus mangrovi]|uniref:Cupin domain-containing protein n=1 Tax=Acuticoccus mangrovi TaxID=2796142 RepID=A0A934IR45_9HYPH|nr:cupin domain-containing protein [Acuticoccus mangrovi]MBJ3777098.1 cupin domain-containing protein [Acuticoccus mangrovi]
MADVEYAVSTEDLRQRLETLAETEGPTFFRLRATLPEQGRTEIPMAAGKTMSVILKTYAGLGENELHRHPNEEHVFVILQGKATFYGPDGETKTVGPNEGVFLPGTAFYRFQADASGPLVMLRVGASVTSTEDVLLRLDPEGNDVDGYSDANKQVDVILSEDKVFG